MGSVFHDVFKVSLGLSFMMFLWFHWVCLLCFKVSLGLSFMMFLKFHWVCLL